VTASKKKTFPVSSVPQYIVLRHVSDLHIQTYKPLRARALTALSYVAGELTKLAEATDVTEQGRKAFVAEQKASAVLEEVCCVWCCLCRST
jgi:hypothetical protein